MIIYVIIYIHIIIERYFRNVPVSIVPAVFANDSFNLAITSCSFKFLCCSKFVPEAILLAIEELTVFTVTEPLFVDGTLVDEEFWDSVFS